MSQQPAFGDVENVELWKAFDADPRRALSMAIRGLVALRAQVERLQAGGGVVASRQAFENWYKGSHTGATTYRTKKGYVSAVTRVAWRAWQMAWRLAAHPPAAPAPVAAAPALSCAREVDAANQQVEALRAQDAELQSAISELRTALGNPAISGEGMQTVASQTVRAAVERLTRKTFVNMGAQALAAELIEAVVKDEADEGLDISAGLFGTHTSEWLRHVAEDYMANPPKPSTCPGVPRAGCNYLATCGSVCYKCGELHAPKGGNF